jgi:two-component sensor histidine kinase
MQDITRKLLIAKNELRVTNIKLKTAIAKIAEIERLNDTMRHETLRQMDIIYAAVSQIRAAEDKHKEINKSLALINAFDELQMLLDIDEQRLISMQSLASNIFEQHNKTEALNPEFVVSGDVALIHNTANPLARVINELIANSFEHAFKLHHKVCCIRLFIKHTDNNIIITYYDTGSGLKKGKPKLYSNKGLYLMYSLCLENLQGKIKKIKQDDYIAYHITIPYA